MYHFKEEAQYSNTLDSVDEISVIKCEDMEDCIIQPSGLPFSLPAGENCNVSNKVKIKQEGNCVRSVEETQSIESIFVVENIDGKFCKVDNSFACKVDNSFADDEQIFIQNNEILAITHTREIKMLPKCEEFEENFHDITNISEQESKLHIAGQSLSPNNLYENESCKVSDDKIGSNVSNDSCHTPLECTRKNLLTQVVQTSYKCNICTFSATEKHELLLHNRIHSIQSPFNCKFCDYLCLEQDILKLHEKTCNDRKPYLCKTCGFKCTKKLYLTRHIKNHFELQPHKCHICDSSFVHQSDFKIHIISHAGGKPYKCDICNALFPQKQGLKRHSLIHTDKKQYICGLCDYSFSQKRNLKRHVAGHTSENAYKCEICGSEFFRKAHLNIHVGRHKHDPVCVLLELPFSRWCENDKKDFFNCEKPMPLLNVNKVAKVKDKLYNRNFKKSWYSQFEWLCGSYYLNKLFCVPCLIISVQSSVWNKNGFNDFGNVTRALHKHEGSSEHMRSALAFAKLKKKFIIDDALKEDSRLCIKQFNDNVQLNRRFMQLPILAVLYLGKQELNFRGHHEDVSSNYQANFKELLDVFLSISSVDIQEHYKKIEAVFAVNSKTIQNEIIECISQYIGKYVENEIKDAQFFSIQVDDCTATVHKSQCSIIIRYVIPSGKLVERFLGFYDVSSNRTAETLYSLVTQCLEKFDYKSKLIGQCFDGASVMSSQLNALQGKVKEVAPQAVFVHCLSHRTNLVLQQSCNAISSCHIFFATVAVLPSFFHHFSKRTYIADTIIGKKLRTSVIAKWTSNSKILSFIHNEWDSLKEVFSEIINDPTSDQSSVRQCDCFLSKFNDFEFVLLVTIFKDICELTDVLADVLEKKSLDVNFCISQVKSTQNLLNSKRNEHTFKNIFDFASSKSALISEGHDQVFANYKILYYEIIDTLLLQIMMRFQDLEKLHFVMLLDNSKFSDYSAKFPTDALKNLKVCYPNLFTDLPRLKNELQLIYNDEQYRNLVQEDVLKIVTENNDIFKESYKLFCLILTIPSTCVSGDHSFSCLKRIRTYLHNTKSEERLDHLSKILIEQELLKELIDTRPFYDDIINKFAALNDRKIDLVYKK